MKKSNSSTFKTFGALCKPWSHITPQCLTSPHSVSHHPTVSHITPQCLTSPHSVSNHPTVSQITPQCLTSPHSVSHHPTVSQITPQCLKSPHCVPPLCPRSSKQCPTVLLTLTSPSTLLHRRSSLTTSSDPCIQSSRFIRRSRPSASSNGFSTSSKHCWW